MSFNNIVLNTYSGNVCPLGVLDLSNTFDTIGQGTISENVPILKLIDSLLTNALWRNLTILS